MGRSLHSQLAFSGGEFSPQLDARVDHPKYQQACRIMQNVIPLRQGGFTRRPGFIFKGMAKYSDTDTRNYASRLIKFQFSPSTSFILEFGDEYIRFYANKEQVRITSAPVWVNTQAYFKGNFVEDPTDGFNIYYCLTTDAGLIPPSANPNNWVLQDIYEVPTPYRGWQSIGPSIYDIPIWRIVPCQVNDVVYLVHPDYPVYKLTRFADDNWTFEAVKFMTPPMLDQNATTMYMGVTAGGTTGNVTLSVNADNWVTATVYQIGWSVNNGDLYTCIQAHTSGTFAADLANGYWRKETPFTDGNTDGYFQIGQRRDDASVEIALTGDGTSTEIEATGDCEFATYGTWAADATLERSDDGGDTWYAVRTITSESDHNGSVAITVSGRALFRIVVSGWTSGTGRAKFTILSGIIYGVVQITGVSSPYLATGLVISELYSTNNTTIWSEGAWSVRRGYPQAITAFQQRMIYGGTAYEPQRIWGTVVDDLENFDLGQGDEDTDAFMFDLAAVGRGRIQWLIGQSGDLNVGFSGAEWVVNSGQGSYGATSAPITATAINAGEQSSYGSGVGVQPALFGSSVLFTQRTGKTLQQMSFSVYTNKYDAADLSMQSEHLFANGIAQIDFQQQFRGQQIVWVVTKGGSLCGMTYDTQYEVFAWAKQLSGIDEETNTVEFIESVAVIPGVGVEDDQVWVAVDRPNGTCIELMNPVNWETVGTPRKGIGTPDTTLAIYVDSAITVESPVSNVIGGLEHLANQEVIALLNGRTAIAPMLVSAGGEITIEGFEPDGADILQIGLPIQYAVKPMRIDVDRSQGVIANFFKSISRLYLRVYNSMGATVIGFGGKRAVVNFTPRSSGPVTGPELFSGDREVVPESTPGYDPTYTIQGSDVFPLTVLASGDRFGITGST
jgi:hypothetical protein